MMKKETGARELRKVEEKWRDVKQTDNDDGIKSNFIGAAGSINFLCIQFMGEYAIVQPDNEPYT